MRGVPSARHYPASSKWGSRSSRRNSPILRCAPIPSSVLSRRGYLFNIKVQDPRTGTENDKTMNHYAQGRIYLLGIVGHGLERQILGGGKFWREASFPTALLCQLSVQRSRESSRSQRDERNEVAASPFQQRFERFHRFRACASSSAFLPQR